LTLLESAELRQRFGQEGRADVNRRFAWERIAEDALRHYCEILERA
jgi:glycosyltransferase involved in cell wall biosynthesis